MSRGIRLLSVVAAVLSTLLVVRSASATHAWGCYHWPRSANPFSLTFGNNLTSNWSPYLTRAAYDWSLTSGACNNSQNPVRATVGPGGANSKNCRPATGHVEVCNGSYGNNGWLGIASIWVSGCHITKGSVKVNDYYFNMAQYSSAAWHSFVMDQETGHILGLDHQDTDFNNADLLDACGRGSCMDYSSDPTNNTTPNQHDYDELVIIYGHSDGAAAIAPGASASAAQNVDEDTDNESSWGRPVEFANGRPDVYERDLGGGNKLVTHVIWVQ